MSRQVEHAQASLLYSSGNAPLHRIDTVALAATIERLGPRVEHIRVQPDYVQFQCDRIEVLVAGFHRPFPLEHFRSVRHPGCDGARRERVTTLLAGHGSSLTVIVLSRAGHLLFAEDSALICREAVDLLLASTSPDLVFWSDRNEIATAAEAETALDTSETTLLQNTPGAVRPRRLSAVATSPTARPAGIPSSRRPGDIDLGFTDFATAPFAIRPRRPVHAIPEPKQPARAVVPAPISAQPVPDIAHPAACEEGGLTLLRDFLKLDDSAEPRRVAETASGRAACYLMSLTIAVFVLPLGAAMLTFNALSGGSFRTTSHAMALTGMFLAMAAAGMPNPAAALGLG